MEHRRHRSACRGHPAAFPQILQGVHRDVDAGRIPLRLQNVPDLRRCLSLGQQHLGVADGLGQRDGDSPVIHHQHPAAVLLGQGFGGVAGAAQPRGHGEVEHRVMGLQQGVPQGGNLLRGRLGGADLRPRFHPLKERLRGTVLSLQIGLPIHKKGHRDQINAHLLGLFGRNTAVGISYNGCLQGKVPLNVDLLAGIPL